MKAETESRIFSVDEYVRPSNGEPIRSVVLETNDSVVVVWHAYPRQEIAAHVHPPWLRRAVQVLRYLRNRRKA